MRDRSKQIARVVAVRELRERLSEVAHTRSTRAVRVIEADLLLVETARTAAVDGCSRALSVGDRGAWALANSMREVARWQQTRLEAARVASLAEADETLRQLQVSQRQREQAEAMQRRALEVIDHLDQRTAQAQSDDRFLARRHQNIGPRA